MKPFTQALAVLGVLRDAAPLVASMAANALSSSPSDVESPAEDRLPKGVSFFKHHLNGVTYHGIRCVASLSQAVLDLVGGGQTHQAAESVVVHCSHGFGASSLSFAPLLQAAQSTRRPETAGAETVWVAHDTLGFGFTCPALPLPVNGEYPPEVLGALRLDANSRPTLSICDAIQGSEKRRHVFVGHSMGCISAIAAAHERAVAGQDVAGVVLLAPAMSIHTLGGNANRFFCAATPLLQSVLALSKGWYMLPRLLRRGMLAALLKAAVAVDLFWYVGLRFAMGWRREVSPDTMEAYKAPMTREDWAPWLVAFMEANVIPPPEGQRRPEEEGITEAQLRYLIESKVKVLIIHDLSDTIIPLCHSKEIAVLYGSRVVFEPLDEDLGHLPHEVAPDLVLAAMAKHGIPF